MQGRKWICQKLTHQTAYLGTSLSGRLKSCCRRAQGMRRILGAESKEGMSESAKPGIAIHQSLE